MPRAGIKGAHKVFVAVIAAVETWNWQPYTCTCLPQCSLGTKYHVQNHDSCFHPLMSYINHVDNH